MACNHVPQFANLPAYAGPGIPTRARSVVKSLTELPERFVEYVDDNVAASKDTLQNFREQIADTLDLPPGSRVKSLFPHGAAYWTRTAAIQTEQEDGSALSFFLKVTHTDVGRVNLMGEFASITAIHQATPGFVPTPIAVGTYASDPDVHFYLCSFVDMTDDVAEIETLPAKLAELHIKGVSPNGKYGFPVPTNQGALAQPNTWTDSWEKFFSEMLQRCFDWEQEMHGRDEEMQELFKSIVEKVIPRLLRPLETGGREIQPRIVHGDLWDGNTSTDATTDKPVIFDASSMYAHNEFELGAWNLPRHKIYKTYIRAYQRCFPISPPEEDIDDRLILYRYRFDLTSSGCYLNNLRFRELAIEDMRYLVKKYPNGYEGTESRKPECDNAQPQASGASLSN